MRSQAEENNDEKAKEAQSYRERDVSDVGESKPTFTDLELSEDSTGEHLVLPRVAALRAHADCQQEGGTDVTCHSQFDGTADR